MIAVDTNILVYAMRADLRWHSEAVACLHSLRQSASRWAIPWPALHEVFATLTRPRRLSPPASTSEALAYLQALTEEPDCVLLHEGPSHFELLRDLITMGNVQGAQVHDARIAAICLSHGVSELWTADRDFSRFPQLRVRNPLVG
jgi:toxin-antitoxin system PIN domain toxin